MSWQWSVTILSLSLIKYIYIETKKINNMEISTTTSVFTWSDEAKQVIKELIVFDNNTRDAQRIFLRDCTQCG